MTIQYLLEICISDSQETADLGPMGESGDHSGCLQKLWTNGFCHTPFQKWSVLHRTRNEKGCVALCPGPTHQAHPPPTPGRPPASGHTLTEAQSTSMPFADPHILRQWLFRLQTTCSLPSPSLEFRPHCGCFYLTRRSKFQRLRTKPSFSYFPSEARSRDG